MGIKGKKEKKGGGKRKEKKERKERKIQRPSGLRRLNGESSANKGVSSPMLQEVGVFPTLVPFRLWAINGHIVQSNLGVESWGSWNNLRTILD